MTLEQARRVVVEDLGVCGCGDPDGVLVWVRTALEAVRDRERDEFDSKWTKRLARIFPREEPFAWLAWYFLDRAELIEHGSNVSGSILSGKGHDFLEALDRFGIEAVLRDPPPATSSPPA